MSRIRRGLWAIATLLKNEERQDSVLVNQGRLLARQNQALRLPNLWDYEFKVFSQWGEDGILQHLTSRLAIRHKTFIEFGVETFHESNCRFLMTKDHWSGFVVDGSQDNMRRLQQSYFYWRSPLRCRAEFLTAENVADVLDESGFKAGLGILSIDIDGNDWHVLKRLHDWQPDIFIVEYNAVFGRQAAVTVPYHPEFQRSKAHYSNLYYGASLPAFATLLGERGYALVGVNGVGSNAFFVRRQLLNVDVREVSIAECFRDSVFRESRRVDGALSFLSGAARLEQIGDLPLLDVLSGQTLAVRDLVVA